MDEKDPNQGSGLELDTSKRTSSANLDTARRTSNPNMAVVRSAARMQPLAAAAPKKLTKARLREGAVDTLLNSFSILSEMLEDFRQSDKFFKYKAFVVAGWLFLSISSVAVSCSGQGPANEIDARLVVSGDAAAPIYLVKNDSPGVWQDVEVIVNGHYKSTLSQVEANGGSVTLSAAVLYDGDGKRAPKTLKITDIEVHVVEPESRVKLLVNGQPVLK